MIPAEAPYDSVRKRRTYLVDSVFPAPLSPLMMMDWFSFRDRISLKALSAMTRSGGEVEGEGRRGAEIVRDWREMGQGGRGETGQ